MAQTTPTPIPDDPNPPFLNYEAGGRAFGEGGPALTSFLPDRTVALDYDSAGRLYLNSTSEIRRIETDGSISTFAQVFPLVADFVAGGDAIYAFGFPTISEEALQIYRIDTESGESEVHAVIDPEIVAECCDSQTQIVVDGSANVFLYHKNRIFRIDADSGQTTHVAGNGEIEFSDDPAPATETAINASEMVFDSRNDTILIVDDYNLRIRRIDPVSNVVTSSERVESVITTGLFPYLHGLDVQSSGEIYFTSPDNNRIHSMSPELVYRGVVVGNGENGPDGDGGPLMLAAIQPLNIALDSNGNFSFSSADFEQNERIRYADLGKDIVSTVLGQPGFLGCSSPLDSFLVFSSGIGTDSDNIIYTQSFNAILAIDLQQSITYTVAGVYGVKGDSPDGVPAFGNPLQPDRTAHSGMAVTPEGDIFLAETGRIRTIDSESGLLGTLVAGEFRAPFYHPLSGRLYALRDSGEWFDFVEINPTTGALTELVTGGAASPVAGESATGRRFDLVLSEAAIEGGKNLNDYAVDKDGNIYLSVNNESAPELASGIYRIDAQTRVLTAIVSEAEDSTRAVLGQMALDEERSLLYYTWLGEADFLGNNEYVPLVKVDLTTGQQTRYAGQNIPGYSYCRDCGSENALETLLFPIDITVADNGDVFLIQSQDEIVRIGAEPRLAPGLIPEDIGTGSNIGNSVASQGNWFAIGVPNSLNGAGEVLVYQDTDCRPILRERLQMPEGYSGSHFGNAIVFAGDNLVIGSRGLAPPTIESGSQSGSAVQSNRIETDPPLQVGVFGLKNGRSWRFDKSLGEILPPSGGDLEIVSEGKTFAVGTPDAGIGQGEVVIFNTADLDQAISVQPMRDNAINFGKSLALSNGKLAVGSETTDGQGRVDLWEPEGSQFVSVAVLEGPQNQQGFASALAMDDQSLYVGAPDPEGGAVFDYALDETGPDLVDSLVDPHNALNTSFGTSLALEDGMLVVGAPQTADTSVVPAQSNSAPGAVNRSSTETDSATSGAITVFGVKDGTGRRQPPTPLFTRLLKGAEAYGHSIEVNNGRVVVGAPETNEGTGTFEAVAKIASPASLSGLWYDPNLDGEGFNVLVTDVGTVVFFYGYDSNGERLWLISDVVVEELEFGGTLDIPMYKAVVGTFSAPIRSSDALVQWGLLSMTYGSLGSATMILTGFDGSKISKAIFLADVTASEARYSGLWFEPALDGEGFNVIAAQVGTVIYYYGSNAAGERLWLISDVLPGTIEDGATLTGKMYEAVGGDYYNPEPSNTSLRDWGTIEARFDDCGNGRFILSGSDGEKTSNVVKLAGVEGAVCG